MEPLSKPLPATGRGFELGFLYDKKVQLLPDQGFGGHLCHLRQI
jgi:hypothetical protein